MMPTSAEILAGLGDIANGAVSVAIAWHALFALALLALVRGWRPSQRVARVLLALPLVSVTATAFAFGNWFNGIAFTAGSAALVALGRMGPDAPVQRVRAWTFWAGVASLAFGWAYPHFLEGPPTAYLFAAPLGVVPCPTLAATIGAALLGGGLGARPWMLTLAALGLAYGAFGALRLGVALDLALVLGALVLLAVSIMRTAAGTG
jgi:hypothetical protein